MLQFYLDGILVSDPVNWADFTETMEHDDTIKGVLPKYENTLQFTGGGFDYLYKKFLMDGYCSFVTLEVFSKCSQSDPFTLEFKGLIFTKDCRFNLNKCLAEAAVEDNNYGARIYNNKTIKVFVNSVLTKNNKVLAPVPETLLTFFRPIDGVYVLDKPIKTYSIYQCFRFIIDFMTDNLVGFESNYLLSGEFSMFNITTGGLIRKPDDVTLPPEVPQISFEMLFTEVNKKAPIAFTVVDRGGKPTIKIENEEYFYSQNESGAVLRNIDDLVQFFNDEVLYSSVKFGGPTADIDLTIHHFAYDKFRSFAEEEYYFTGECNIDKVLDLVGTWIADSNIIEELFVTNTDNDSYDTDIFFIQYIFGNAVQAPNPLTLADPFYYNPKLTNDQVAMRYKSLELILQDNVLSFRAALGADQLSGALYLPPAVGATDTSPQLQVRFDQDSALPNYDTTGNYNTSTWRYTAPQAGQYVFESGMSFIKDDPNNPVDTGQQVEVHMVFARFNSANAQVETVDNLVGIFDFDGNYPIRSAATFILNIGDYVIVRYYHIRKRISSLPIGFTVIIGHGSWFRNVSSPTAAIRPTYGVNLPYQTSGLDFEYPISKEQWNLIKNDLSRSIIVNNGDGRNRKSWIRKISRNFSTSIAECELITDIKF